MFSKTHKFKEPCKTKGYNDTSYYVGTSLSESLVNRLFRQKYFAYKLNVKNRA